MSGRRFLLAVFALFAYGVWRFDQATRSLVGIAHAIAPRSPESDAYWNGIADAAYRESREEETS